MMAEEEAAEEYARLQAGELDDQQYYQQWSSYPEHYDIPWDYYLDSVRSNPFCLRFIWLKSCYFIEWFIMCIKQPMLQLS